MSYVTPSDPHTGWAVSGQEGGQTHVGTSSITLQMECGFEQTVESQGSAIINVEVLGNRYNMSGDSLADLQTRAFGEPKASQKREFVNQLENRHEYCI